VDPKRRIELVECGLQGICAQVKRAAVAVDDSEVRGLLQGEVRDGLALTSWRRGFIHALVSADE